MLMHALADHCTINARPGGTTVCLDYTTKSIPLQNATIGAESPASNHGGGCVGWLGDDSPGNLAE
jgi:hypothetical protein